MEFFDDWISFLSHFLFHKMSVFCTHLVEVHIELAIGERLGFSLDFFHEVASREAGNEVLTLESDTRVLDLNQGGVGGGVLLLELLHLIIIKENGN